MIAPAISLATAGTAKQVQDITLNPAENVPLNSPVYISWTGADGTVDVAVYDPENNPVEIYTIIDIADFSTTNLDMSFSGQIYFNPAMQGTYIVELTGNPATVRTDVVASASVFVVPESVLGGLAALGAGIAAFGTVAVVKRRRA